MAEGMFIMIANRYAYGVLRMSIQPMRRSIKNLKHQGKIADPTNYSAASELVSALLVTHFILMKSTCNLHYLSMARYSAKAGERCTCVFQ